MSRLQLDRRPRAPRLVAALLVGLLGVGAYLASGNEPVSQPPAPDAPVATRARAHSPSPFPPLQATLQQVDDGDAPSATLTIEGRSARFALGHEVFPGIRLSSVGEDNVVLSFGNATRTLFLADGTATAQATAAATDEAPEIRALNQQVDVRQLTASRPQSAEAFLHEVQLLPQARGGFVVESVLADSRYERMGLRPGDVLYTLDTPRMAAIDETSMVALMQQTELELDVYRAGTLQRLQVALNVDPDPPKGRADVR